MTENNQPKAKDNQTLYSELVESKGIIIKVARNEGAFLNQATNEVKPYDSVKISFPNVFVADKNNQGKMIPLSFSADDLDKLVKMVSDAKKVPIGGIKQG